MYQIPNFAISFYISSIRFRNIFLSIKNTTDNLQKIKTMTDVSRDFKLVKSWRQPQNLERILCKSKFSSKPKIFKNCNKSCFYCEYN